MTPARPKVWLAAAAAILTLPMTLSISASPAPAKTAGTASGKVVSVATGKPIRGVKVRITDWSTKVTLGSDLTGRLGRFSVGPITEDEIGVYVNGTDAGYEKGWLGCGHKIVKTWGEACTFSADELGLIKLKSS